MNQIDRRGYTDMSGVPTDEWARIDNAIAAMTTKEVNEFDAIIEDMTDRREGVGDACRRLFKEGWDNNRLRWFGEYFLWRGIQEGWLVDEIGITQIG